MSNDQEIAPCPFCGGDAQDDFIEGESYLIECYVCEANTGSRSSAENAIAAWNRRAAPPVAESVAVPAGFVLVPLVPTPEMLAAMVRGWQKAGYNENDTLQDWRGALTAAIAAAPTPLPAGDGLRQHERSPVYGIIDPDYARYYSIIRCTAWSYGYAIGMHGSFTRDLDLIAAPWTEHACPPNRLIKIILHRTDLTESHGNPTSKPQGRLQFTLHLPGIGDPRWIDLSIMPMPPIAAIEAERAGGEARCDK